VEVSGVTVGVTGEGVEFITFPEKISKDSGQDGEPVIS
jgi:hypothetical protein